MRLLLALVAAAALSPRGPEVYRLTLKASAPDSFLPAPKAADVVLRVDARAAAPKSRFMFLAPLPAGRHRLRLEIAGPVADRTFVVAVPLASGHSSVEVVLASGGRYDLGFWAGERGAPSKEYKFTVRGPATRTFDLDLP